MSTRYYRKSDPEKLTVAVRFAGIDHGPLVPRMCFQFYDAVQSDELLIEDDTGAETTIADEIRESVGWFNSRRDEHDAMTRASRDNRQTQRVETTVAEIASEMSPVGEMLARGLMATAYFGAFIVALIGVLALAAMLATN